VTLESGVWRLDHGLQAIDFGSLEIAGRLEGILDQGAGLGRQSDTASVESDGLGIVRRTELRVRGDC
jgi:hypothetical protein